MGDVFGAGGPIGATDTSGMDGEGGFTPNPLGRMFGGIVGRIFGPWKA